MEMRDERGETWPVSPPSSFSSVRRSLLSLRSSCTSAFIFLFCFFRLTALRLCDSGIR